MHEIVLSLECREPEAVKKSLDPDIKNTEKLNIDIMAKENIVEIRVKGRKMGHLKAVMNSYLDVISTLDQIEDLKTD